MKRKNSNFNKLVFLKKRRTIALLLAIMVSIMFITASSANRISNVNEKLDDKEASPQQPSDRHGTGFMPPKMDLSHLTGQEMPKRFIGLTPPSSFDWRTLDKVTSVKDQLTCNACWAFASLACFESKIMIDGGGTYDLSEDNVKECEWHHKCCNPSNFWRVANYLSQDGTVLESDDPYQPSHNVNPPCDTKPYQQTLLDWRVIAGDNIPSTTVLKNYIYNEGPVYVSIWSGAIPYNAAWRNEFVNYDGSYTLYKPWTDGTDHAVIIVGWDDSLTHAGGTGGWICKNSWGTNWGGTCGYGTEKGYFTIAYGSAAIGKFSSYVDQWGKYDTNGGIVYYDEGGYTYWWGYSSKTAWGLCKYGFMFDTVVTRVEFWTIDETTDVDVYIYDDFDGTTLSNLLWSSLDHSFSEAGYHGVSIIPPMMFMGMNPIYVVVKFTNKNIQQVIASDDMGPTETGCTYTSPDGSSGSWVDRGTGSPKSDVAIRLRISGDNPPSDPTITGQSSGNAGTSYPYDFVSTDPEVDEVSYYIKWGDGSETDWTPFQNSGTKYTESHTWSTQGTYNIEAKARDIYGVESDWEILTVTIPRNKMITNSLFFSLLERFPNAFPILRYLLGL
jgi:C1A family cysteine protease